MCKNSCPHPVVGVRSSPFPNGSGDGGLTYEPASASINRLVPGLSRYFRVARPCAAGVFRRTRISCADTGAADANDSSYRVGVDGVLLVSAGSASG